MYKKIGTGRTHMEQSEMAPKKHAIPVEVQKRWSLLSKASASEFKQKIFNQKQEYKYK
jgi:hypothetical protein